jgi:hypothetical protein
VWRGCDRPIAYRRELRRRGGRGSAARLAPQLEASAAALEAALLAQPEGTLIAPGGEEDWNVAQTFAHTTGARRFLAGVGELAASGEWPSEQPPRIVPGVPGPADADRDRLLALLEKSRVAVARSAQRIAGRELTPVPIRHPLAGQLTAGEWLLMAGVHDVMHLQQLHRLLARGLGASGLAMPGLGTPADSPEER